MRPVYFTPAARVDFLDAFDWYETASPGLGNRFRDETDAVMQLIADNPQMFAEIYRGTRRALLKKFPYGLFYRIETDAIFVIACFHSSRDPRVWQQRG
jgi:plasmid stabilization system protein ParE